MDDKVWWEIRRRWYVEAESLEAALKKAEMGKQNEVCVRTMKERQYEKLKEYRCQNCEKEFGEGEFLPLEKVKDLIQRIMPGERVPAGECPDCEALVHLERRDKSTFVRVKEGG